MWVHGTVVTLCDIVEVIDDNVGDLSIQEADGEKYILNGRYICRNFAHELALRTFAKVIGMYRTGMELISLDGLSTCCRDVTVVIKFRLNLNILNPKFTKDLIGYCSDMSQDLDAERPSYHLVDVMNKSAQGLPVVVVDLAGPPLSRLPTQVLNEKLVKFLSAKDLRAMNKTCKALTQIGTSFVPGLKPTLFRHQRASVFHMEHQEINPANLAEVFVHKVVSNEGHVLFIDAVSGRYVAPDNLGHWRARRGGLLCDAPGLGKTVAALSLILRTKGMLPLEVEDAVTEDVGVEGFNKRTTPPRAAKSARYDIGEPRKAVTTTLIVVPHALVNHWRSQIAQHVEPNALKVFVKESVKDPWPDSLCDVHILLVSSACLSDEATYSSSFLEDFSFLRLIIDEGHSLGANETSFTRMCRRITAERFWVVTGTPAKLTNNTAGLKSLRSILRFLRASPIDPMAFTEAITRGFKSKNHPPCEAILVRLLKRVLIRHRKQDVLAELPELVSENRVLQFGDRERDNYNLLVSFIRTNLILTSIGTTGGWDQSLLNPLFAKKKMELLMYLRSACVGSVAGEARRLFIRDDDFLETHELFSGESAEVQRNVNDFLIRSTKDHEMSACTKCGLRLKMLLLTRCAHLYCTECINPDAPCHICSAHIDADDLAAIQPGFNLERVVLDLGGADVGAKAGYIVRRIEEERHRVREQTIQMLAEKKSIASLPQKPKFIVFSQFRESLNIIGDQLIRRFGSDFVAEFWGKYQTVELNKFKENKVDEWVCERCHGVNTDHLAKKCSNIVAIVAVSTPNGPHSVTTITVFQPETQILGWVPDMPLVSVHLREPRQTGMLTGFGPCSFRRNMEAPLISREVQCDVLLLSREGSHGLDLSCATHVFILDLVWDAAVEEQIVSRAWRLGNKAKRVVVEHLVMKDSMEELLMKRQGQKRDYLGEIFEQAEGVGPIEMHTSSDDPRIKYVFENIRLVRPQ